MGYKLAYSVSSGMAGSIVGAVAGPTVMCSGTVGLAIDAMIVCAVAGMFVGVFVGFVLGYMVESRCRKKEASRIHCLRSKVAPAPGQDRYVTHCLSCNAEIEAGSSVCQKCGWTYGNSAEDTGSHAV